MTQATLNQALEALESVAEYGSPTLLTGVKVRDAIVALRQEIEKPAEKLLLEHSGCGHGRQIEQITIGLYPGDKVFVRYGLYSAVINAKEGT